MKNVRAELVVKDGGVLLFRGHIVGEVGTLDDLFAIERAINQSGRPRAHLTVREDGKAHLPHAEELTDDCLPTDALKEAGLTPIPFDRRAMALNLTRPERDMLLQSQHDTAIAVVVEGRVEKDSILPLDYNLTLRGVEPGMAWEDFNMALVLARKAYKRQASLHRFGGTDQSRPASAEDATGDEFEVT